jgi:hypothetical protein
VVELLMNSPATYRRPNAVYPHQRVVIIPGYTTPRKATPEPPPVRTKGDKVLMYSVIALVLYMSIPVWLPIFV